MTIAKATDRRDYLIDNLKIILITLVVVGHSYGSYMQQNIYLKAIVICISIFHMPLFIFISGYFSKSERSIDPNKLVKNLLIPYIVLSLLWDMKEIIHSKVIAFDILDPPFHLWYLISLFSWRLLLPIYKQIKHHLLISIIIALVVSMSPLLGHTLSLSRTLTLFPFFIMGTLCTQERLLAIHRMKYVILISASLLIMIGYFVVKYDSFELNMFTWDQPYLLAGFKNNFDGILFHSILFIVIIAISIGVIAATSNRKTLYSNAGSRTLMIYIFHAFLLPSFVVRFPEWNTSTINKIIILILPFILSYLLSLKIINDFYQKVMNRINQIILKDSILQDSKLAAM